MPRKPVIPQVGPHARGADKGLGVKDGLREVRFNVKHEARKLVHAVEAATQRYENSTPGPLGLLSEPLNLAVRTAAQLLSHVDHAAVDLLAPDAAYRSMTVQLRPSSSFFSRRADPDDLHTFTIDHHWRYRHWLAMRLRDDVFVHQQQIATAGAQVAEAVRAAPLAPANDGLAEADGRPQASALVVQALLRQRIFSRPALSGEEDEDELAALARLGAVVVVLAGEIAAAHPSTGDAYAATLRLADEIAVADRPSWETVLRAQAPTEALTRWFAFVLRHL